MENIDKFNDFLDKYNKTGYISKKSEETIQQFNILSKLGLSKKSIDELNKNIDIARDFFKSQDFEVLRDLLHDITDIYPLLSYDYGVGVEESIYYRCGLKIDASANKYGSNLSLYLRYHKHDE